MQLPWGATLHAAGVVTSASARGAGVRFELDEGGEHALTEVLQRISSRPRTAVVVDDDALARRMLSDALAERGFVVRCASGGLAGIHLLADHLLETDLLVTDVRMHAMDGEALVRTIREAGGERDLAIVAVTGSWEAGIDARLRAAGAQVLLDKALGAELIARAAEAIVARRAPAGSEIRPRHFSRSEMCPAGPSRLRSTAS
jgi:CheY-like chemotaxis protein